MKRLAVVGFTTLCLFVLAQAPAFAWTLGVIERSVLDSAPSVAVSASDHVWVAWEHTDTNDLFWAKWTGSSWSTTQVAGAGTSGCNYRSWTLAPAAGFDPLDGTARIASVCDDDNAGVSDPSEHEYIRWTYRDARTGDWVSTKILQVPEGNCGTHGTVDSLSLAFDPATGLPGIAFGDSNTGRIYWLRSDGSHWHLEVVGKEIREFCRATLGVSADYDPVTGRPAIAWNTTVTPELRYSTRDANGTWTAQSVAPTGPYGSLDVAVSLAFAPTGVPWIAFTQGWSDGEKYRLAVATPADAVWTVSTVDDVDKTTGLHPSLAMQGSLPSIAYYDYTKRDVRFASSSGTGWTLSIVDPVKTTYLPSLGISAAGDAYVAYRYFLGQTKMGLKWARPSA